MKTMKTKTMIMAAAVGMMALTAACSDPALPALRRRCADNHRVNHRGAEPSSTNTRLSR